MSEPSETIEAFLEEQSTTPVERNLKEESNPEKYFVSTIVSRKCASPFATLVLVQNTGGAYMQDATFSRNYALPSGATHLAAWRRDAPNATGWLTSFIVER